MSDSVEIESIGATCESDLIHEFKSTTGLTPKHSVYGSNLTTMSLGGKLSCYIELNSIEEVINTINFLTLRSQPYLILGGGSNLLISDLGINRWIIKLGRGFRYVKKIGEQQASGGGVQLFEVGGAMPLMSLSRELSQQGYSGLEFAGGIPATFGGAVRMNAGAHGGEIKDILKSIEVIASNGLIQKKKSSEMTFSYRRSGLAEGVTVLSGIIELQITDSLETSQRRAEFLAQRKKHQPLTMPSFGSVFKNPTNNLTAGKLLESVGLKGVKCGGAQYSDMHANWIVNPDRVATLDDVKRLISLGIEKVSEKHQIVLEPEVIIWE